MGGRDLALLQLVRPARPEGPQRLPDVRPPDGRAAPLREGRMRLVPRFAAPVIALAVIAAGCGGSQVAFQEVPGDPPQMTVPGTAEAFAPSPTATPAATTDASATTDTAAATPTPATSDTTGTAATPTAQTGTGTTTGGSTAPSTGD